MKKTLVSFLALAFAGACSGESADFESEELGQAEQPYVTQQATSGSSLLWTGVHEAVAATRQVKSSCQSGMNAVSTCYVPQSKGISLAAVNTSCSSTSFSRMVTSVANTAAILNTLLSPQGWTVSVAPAGQFATVVVACDTSLPGTGTDVDDYSRTFAGPCLGACGLLNESLPGTFFTKSSWTAKVNVTASRSAVLTEPAAVANINHAVGHAVIKAFGVGRGGLVGFSSFPTMNFSSSTSPGILNNGELCRTRGYSVTAPSNVYTTSTSSNCVNI